MRVKEILTSPITHVFFSSVRKNSLVREAYVTVLTSSFVFGVLLHFLYADHSTSEIGNRGSYTRTDLMGKLGTGTIGWGGGGGGWEGGGWECGG